MGGRVGGGGGGGATSAPSPASPKMNCSSHQSGLRGDSSLIFWVFLVRNRLPKTSSLAGFREGGHGKHGVCWGGDGLARARGKLACGGGGGGRGSPRRRGGVWQWGSCDRTLGKVPITSNRGCEIKRRRGRRIPPFFGVIFTRMTLKKNNPRL